MAEELRVVRYDYVNYPGRPNDWCVELWTVDGDTVVTRHEPSPMNPATALANHGLTEEDIREMIDMQIQGELMQLRQQVQTQEIATD